MGVVVLGEEKAVENDLNTKKDLIVNGKPR